MLGSLFFEPSTRTSSSFDAAMQRLGGSVIHLNQDSSSAAKGESFKGTMVYERAPEGVNDDM